MLQENQGYTNLGNAIKLLTSAVPCNLKNMHGVWMEWTKFCISVEGDGRGMDGTKIRTRGSARSPPYRALNHENCI